MGRDIAIISISIVLGGLAVFTLGWLAQGIREARVLEGHRVEAAVFGAVREVERDLWFRGKSEAQRLSRRDTIPDPMIHEPMTTGVM